MKQAIWILSLLCLALVFTERITISYSLEPLDTETILGTKDDPMARIRFEQRRLVSPLTGEIPINIRERELAFDAFIQKQPDYLKRAAFRKAETVWELAGPFNVGGRTRGAGIDIRDENIILAAGVSGGIWKTIDGGISWSRTTHPDIHNGVSYMVQDTRTGKENIWYAGTGEQIGNSARGVGAIYRGNGILKSTDYGNSWNFLESTQDSPGYIFNSQFQYIWNIVPNKKKSTINEVFVAAYGGILRTQDEGENWDVVLGNKLFDLPAETDINTTNDPSYTHIHQNPSGHFFATLSSASSVDQNYPQGGFYFSVDGETWKKITPTGLSGYHERTIIHSGGSSGNNVYFLTHTDNEDELWLYTYNPANTNNNGSWLNLSDNIPAFGGEVGDFDAQSGYNMVLAVHPQNETIVFIAGTNLYRSTNGFKTSKNTNWIGGYHSDGSVAQYPSHHADQHLLLFYPNDPNKILSCHDGGLSVSNNGTADSVIYRSINNGYVTTQFYSIAQEPNANSDITMGGMQDNGSYIRETRGTNKSWTKLIQGDGGYAAVAPNKDFIYSGLQEGLIFRLNVNSSNDIVGFARVDPAGGGESTDQEYLFVTPFMLDPINPNKMFFAGGDVLWRNRNLAQIPNGSQDKTSLGWDVLPKSKISIGVYTCLAKSQETLYAGAFQQQPFIAKIENASYDGEEITTRTASPNFPELGYINSIAADPEDPDFLLVVFSNYEVPSIFLSTDGAVTFEDVSGNLEENPDGSGDGPSVRWVEIATTEDGNIYFVGTSIGLFSTRQLDGSNTIWTKEGSEVIGRSVITMLDYRGFDGKMVIASHGNGTFRGYIENPKNPTTSNNENFTLAQNYPNPFVKSTLIDFTLPETGIVRIDILDSHGQTVRNLLWGTQYPGKNTIYWDGTNPWGAPVPNGVYYYRLTYKGKSKTKRLVYMN